MSPSNEQPSARRSHRGFWYSAILVALAGLVLTVWIASNPRQLKPEQLAQAQALWEAKGPRDYDVEYTTQTDSRIAYVVSVRDGKATSATMNGEPLKEDSLPNHSMSRLFKDIQRFLEIDAQPGQPHAIMTATFDADDGHLRYFARRVPGTQEHVEIVVQRLQPVAEE